MIRERLPAIAVHIFTATGAVLGFLALLAAEAKNWEVAFLWLAAALLVDALDGPIARTIDVKKRLPRFSGERLDLVVDYLTYVLIPAYIIYSAHFMPNKFHLIAAAIILLSSLFHFADRESKTKDGFFVGFPTLWNIVALYFFIYPTPPVLAFVIVLCLAALTFSPLKWVHPVRVPRWRVLTLSVVAMWGITVTVVLVHGFPASTVAQVLLAIFTLYVVGVGLIRSSRGPADTNFHGNTDG